MLLLLHRVIRMVHAMGSARIPAPSICSNTSFALYGAFLSLDRLKADNRELQRREEWKVKELLSAILMAYGD
jgi:hypothetical protein